MNHDFPHVGIYMYFLLQDSIIIKVSIQDSPDADFVAVVVNNEV